MGKKHFIEEQIAYALRQQEADTPVTELTHKLGVSEQKFYGWKRKFAASVSRSHAGSGMARPIMPPVSDSHADPSWGQGQFEEKLT